uniref:hypothetical protein n=1 Tax=Roseiarcus sp. TaxID=1969460 RepID=UPI003F965A38
MPFFGEGMYLPTSARAREARRDGEMGETRLFHAPAKNAAAHQPGVDLPGVGLPVCDQDGDDSVVAESVDQANLHDVPRRVVDR